MKVQVKLPHLLPRFRVAGAVKLHVLMPHVGVLHLGEGEAQQLLVDAEQPLGHRLQREILDQLVLVHGKLALLHLVHVVGQIPGVDLLVKRVALHQALPLLQRQNVFPLLESDGLQTLVKSICRDQKIQYNVM